MSWDTFKQNILDVVTNPETTKSTDEIADLYAKEYDAAIKRGSDNIFQSKMKTGNVDSLKLLIKSALDIGVSQKEPYDLVGEMGKGVLAYWAGAQLDPSSITSPTTTLPATGAVQNIQIVSIVCTNSGQWQQPTLGGIEPDLRNENEENDDMPDTEIGETQEILGEVPIDEESDDPQPLQESETSYFDSNAEEITIGKVDDDDDPQIIPTPEDPTSADPTPADPKKPPTAIVEEKLPSISKNVGKNAPPPPPGLASFGNGKIPKDKLGSIDASYGGGILHVEAAKMYNKLLAQAKREGVKWRVSSTYRDYAGQVACFKKYGKGSAASPGSSPHGWGLSLDFGEICGMQEARAKALTTSTGKKVGRAQPAPARYTRENSKIYQWLAVNGPKYGWYNPYRLADGTGCDEAWHWEYWGFYTLTKEQRQA
jgi:LAS superfamily LD-carboxypeptidase LdcB